MITRVWQKVAVGLSIALLIVVLVFYRRDDEAPTKRVSGAPHVGAQHHTAETRHQGGELSPLQVYGGANVGDWHAYRVITETSLAPPITATAIVAISKVTETTVTRSFSGRIDATGEVRQDRDENRPRQGLTLDQLTGNDVGGWTFTDIVVTDEVHEIASRSFQCKKISYHSYDPLFPTKRTHTDLWVSADVPAGGLVEEREVQELGNQRFVLTQQLLGFGDAAGTTWGTRPAGL